MTVKTRSIHIEALMGNF